MRELIIQLNAASRTISQTMSPLVRCTTMVISRKLGTTSIRSTIHISVRSRQPPKYPEIVPTVAAMMVEMNATQTPISMDFCIPRRVWASRTWPSAFVPNQWSVLGGCCSA